MITLRKAAERGRTRLDWLDSRHTFSFGEYYDPRHMGFASLRVINDDRVVPGAGFPTHPHRNMEIVTYVLEGALEHKDSMGNGSVIRRGEVQRMSAGSGVTHSEFNASQTEPAHFLQVWIEPDRIGIAPGYEQKAFPDAEKRGRLRLIVSPDGRDGSLTVHQDAFLYATVPDGGDALEYRPAPGRKLYLHVARGEARVNGESLEAGDGAEIVEERLLRLGSDSEGEILLFDLA